LYPPIWLLSLRDGEFSTLMSRSTVFMVLPTPAFLPTRPLPRFAESPHVAVCGRIVLCHLAWHASACNGWLHEAFMFCDKECLPLKPKRRPGLRVLLVSLTDQNGSPIISGQLGRTWHVIRIEHRVIVPVPPKCFNELVFLTGGGFRGIS
jgi:hypothetical protein